MANTEYEKLLRAAHDERQRVIKPDKMPGAQLLVACLFVPMLLLNLFPGLALYFLLLAPAFPVIVVVLFLQMRGQWRRPEIAVGLSTLIGFAIGFCLLFLQNYSLIAAKFQTVATVTPQ